MDVESTEGAVGDPGVLLLFGDDLCRFEVDLFPVFDTDHHVNVEMVFAIGAEGVADLVDPLEMLSKRCAVSHF